MFYKVTPIWNPPPNELPDLLAEATKQVATELMEKGFNPYVHTLDVRLVSGTNGYSTIQVRAFPREKGTRIPLSY